MAKNLKVNACAHRSLERLIVLFVDCQTTGAHPGKGDIIEIGWARSDTFSSVKTSRTMKTYLVKLPEGRKIPKRTQTVTGIDPDDVAAGHDACDIWKRLLDTAENVAHSNHLDVCPTIIHFAKFEEPFLRSMHEKNALGRDFPLSIICTHEIARRLFPGLPRRGIRAVAGYFGYAVGEYRRCRDHVAATAHIWRELVKILKEKHNITTLEDLQQWLASPVAKGQADRVYPMKIRIRRALPDCPGVYRMLRSNGDVLYIGKARSLKKRINSYFRKRSRHPEHILEMLSQAKQLDITETESTLEAAILESDDIKRYAPAYNIALRKRERTVWFCRADFKEFSPAPSRRFRIGPVVSREKMERLAAIKYIMKAGSSSHVNEDVLLTALGVPPKYAPDGTCISAGFDLFLQHHVSKLHTHSIEHALTQLGRNLWLQRLKEEKDKDIENNEDEIEEKIDVWTPETVAHMFESNVRRGMHALRKARWLVLLSESSLVWQDPPFQKNQRVLLVFEQGKVVHRENMTPRTEIPIPPGFRRTFSERQQNFDLMTMDRMRVVTAEMRRIVSAGRWVKLCLRPTVTLDRDKLAKMLQWI
ncbi:MAG: GIY-YIG nuclease family protein [candidate division WOR-3 bacterium]|nr:MAG: GIY-YIG nuclease family protein [candidate division WOR-3 bacterium]